jgi:hypothetical protein
VRWPPKDGQPALTVDAALTMRAELEAPAAALEFLDGANEAPSGRCAFTIRLFAWPNV